METAALMSIARQNGLYFSFAGAKPRRVETMSDDELKNGLNKWYRVMGPHNKALAVTMIEILEREIKERKHAKKEPASI